MPQKYYTWAAMVTYQLQDRERWLTVAMCDTLQLNRAGRHRVIKRRQREVLAGVVIGMDEWARSHMQWLEALPEEWGLLLSTRKCRGAD